MEVQVGSSITDCLGEAFWCLFSEPTAERHFAFCDRDGRVGIRLDFATLGVPPRVGRRGMLGHVGDIRRRNCQQVFENAGRQCI